ncbi:sigma 54-dependent transcriptional activator containing CheY-like receiver domain [Hahella chejuensis KCTC 2396]|uniref:Sigma 54-dependent transcriptional activator containing CheY-like receiver domain n=1 Tax=Hahella chejuensis (strain KCTC 2396) TaxID=349521 RepID=Q2S7T0_HAHCH|nr:sigma 54-interacting transcriptional regulator [Hahella chejuensis]ABC33294.1 sigma 54-dependent transcriptional activator containing CheY-like receiver domain [Hahella chejuensis KCTC 2396]
MKNPAKPRILLVDDDSSLLRLLSIRLESAGYDVYAVESATEALKQLQQNKFNLLITDLRMDEIDGIGLFERVQAINASLPVIIITAHGTIPEAVSATQKGVFGFLPKPIEKEQLLNTIEAALSQTQHHMSESWCEEIISTSSRMQQLLGQAKMAAQTNVNILITGPSGTGKELLARAVHKASPRANKPFVTINCGALPEQLLESELFGHTKGAFTGAVKDYPGLFRSASGGTLFLDEIGDMPLSLQVKLLRAIQEKQIRSLGSVENEAVDVRILSATHRDLEKAMEENEFREDLYYRLNVVNFALPPLEERAEDIPALVKHILSTRKDQRNGFVKGIAPEAMALLCEAKWPGNIRQLVNVVEQTIALTTNPIISAAMVKQALANRAPELPSFNEARATFERGYLTKVLSITEGSVSQAARLAQRNRTDFYKLLAKYEIDPAAFKNS